MRSASLLSSVLLHLTLTVGLLGLLGGVHAATRAPAPTIRLQPPTTAGAVTAEDAEPPEETVDAETEPSPAPEPVEPVDDTIEPFDEPEPPTPRARTLAPPPPRSALLEPLRRPTELNPPPPRAVPQAAGPVEAAQVEAELAIDDSPPLVYPPFAVRWNLQGTVRVVVDLDADGKVRATRLAPDGSSGHEILDASAVRQVLAWRYHPATEAGVPVPTTFVQDVVFVLQPRR